MRELFEFWYKIAAVLKMVGDQPKTFLHAHGDGKRHCTTCVA